MPFIKQCSKCKTPFECNNDAGGCWCEGYTISLPVLQQLKDSYENCLCQSCLKEYVLGQSSVQVFKQSTN